MELETIDLIGWLATTFVIVSFLINNMLWLRFVNLIGAILWLCYGIIDLSYSIPRLKSKRKTVENQINEKSILSSNKILEDTINTEIAKLDLENTSIKLIFEYLKECKKSIKEIIK